MTTTTISSFQRCIVSVLIIVLFDYLAGCAPGTVEPSSPTPIPTAAPTEKPVATLTEFPTQMPFVPKANISIVVHVPLSGPQSADGVDIQRAQRTWLPS